MTRRLNSTLSRSLRQRRSPPAGHRLAQRCPGDASRADAQLMLEKAKQYFAQYEPNHPAPLMIERVQRLSELNMDIIRDRRQTALTNWKTSLDAANDASPAL